MASIFIFMMKVRTEVPIKRRKLTFYTVNVSDPSWGTNWTSFPSVSSPSLSPYFLTTATLHSPVNGQTQASTCSLSCLPKLQYLKLSPCLLAFLLACRQFSLAWNSLRGLCPWVLDKVASTSPEPGLNTCPCIHFTHTLGTEPKSSCLYSKGSYPLSQPPPPILDTHFKNLCCTCGWVNQRTRGLKVF